MKRIIFFSFLLVSVSVFSQKEDAWVFFKDKPNSSYFIANPLYMLSQEALDRRGKQNIELNATDAPIEESYLTQICSVTGLAVKTKSKWLNAVHVRGTIEMINGLASLNFVEKIEFANKSLSKSRAIKKTAPKNKKLTYFNKIENFEAYQQLKMLNVDFLHEEGYKGEGVKIAILDGGFSGVESLAVFQNLHDNNLNNGEILGGYNFVDNSDKFYKNTGSTHGLSVLSTIATNMPQQLIGSAPNSQFYLFVTEDAANENPVEESYWVAAAEKADSLGVEIINTSLGYTKFDDSKYNYTYQDMDGKTTFISRGAKVATEKGMLLVTSAGNSGTTSWKYISAPADAEGVLAVGAVNKNQEIASFSSYGPSSDNRVKPEVLAQGWLVYVLDAAGAVVLSNGTSFSSPIIAGAAACLWQAYPEKTSKEIYQMIVRSSSLFSEPTDQGGYGIPNFKFLLDKEKPVVYPNPSVNSVNVYTTINQPVKQLVIRNFQGTEVLFKSAYQINQEIDIRTLPTGIYFIELVFANDIQFIKLIKK